ncbi:recombinase family protein [Streptomyces sp. NPDC086766]|uniref:recombinase family protein n=1 Tax=Streptomyces sp. NPDC086766 TaxID=3365754 RepID=UPI003811073E
MRTAPPKAYIYDRCVTDSRATLELRLAALGEYVTERGWQDGGRFVDYGDDALTSDARPQFDELLHAVHEASGEDRVCLVFDWGRLSHDADHRQDFARRVLGAGAWLATVGGDSIRLSAVSTGRLTDGPVIA